MPYGTPKPSDNPSPNQNGARIQAQVARARRAIAEDGAKGESRGSDYRGILDQGAECAVTRDRPIRDNPASCLEKARRSPAHCRPDRPVPIAPPNQLRLVVYGAGHADAAWRRALPTAAAGLPIAWHDGADPLAVLREVAAAEPQAEILLLESNAVLPPLALARLLRAAAAAPWAAVLSPLGNAEPALAPARPDRVPADVDPVALDRGCWLYGTRSTWPTAHWSRSCALWRRPALSWLLAQPRAEAATLPDGVPGAVHDGVYVADPRQRLRAARPPADPRDAAPASALELLRSRVAPIATAAPCLPGADGRPVVLHVVHGWGGGAMAFIHDLALADPDRCHLALVARGSSLRRQYGEALELVLPALPAAPALARWPLPRPLAATTDGDPAHAAILAEVLREYAVDGLSISSLIGHDLGALRTGLPTTVVCHDFYPLWPVLHCDFGDGARRFDRDELARELARAELPFIERDAGAWWALRERYVATLLATRPGIAVPTATVRENLLRLEPRLAELGPRVVAHGFRAFPAGAPAGRVPRHVGKPRVLVLGRIQGGKGAELLREVIPALVARCDFHLLGAGTSGFDWFGCSGVDIELDYARDELPALVARIAPDLALIAASVAETWSYTLSELQALRVPVLATAIGSLAERVVDGINGWTVAPRAGAIVARVQALLDDPAALAAMRERLASITLRDSAAMAADHAAALPLQARGGSAGLAPSQPLALVAAEALAGRAEARALVAKQQAEVKAHAAWAEGMERQFRERSRWAAQLEQELAGERATNGAELARLGAEFEQRTQWALRLDHELKQLRGIDSPLLASKASRWITAGLRRLMALEARLRASARFRLDRAAALGTRAQRSLKARGVAGTFKRAAEFFERTPGAPVAPLLPDHDAPFAPFTLPGSETPRASIVIPVYNHFAHTLGCLRSIARNADGAAFEVIVVDDCSSDETAARLAEIGGIRVLRNAQNLGFIGACNAGAAQARGEFIVFLNNDTAVTAGWLDALLGTFEARADCGLAGAKLVYPDGRLQEAGGIVFADGSGWNYGRYDDPAAPACNYLREADYCSGAAIALRRELYQRLGGFDTRYAPAYYEDTDLAFRVREAGLKVYYQPAATVVHFEGVSSGTDTGSGIKRYQLVNQEKFRERWADALALQPKPGTPIALAREHRVRGRVLVVDACTPMPDRDSGSLRMLNLVRLLQADGWKVSFLAENLAHHGHYTEALQRLGVEALYHPWIADPVAWLREHGSLLDVVVLSRHYVASAYAPLVRVYAPHARLVFDTVDLHYLRERRAAELSGDPEALRAAARTEAQELKLVRAADVTVVVSPVEQEILRRECPSARIEVLSNVHEVAGSRRDFASRRDLYFVGSYQHPPNVDAMRWFVREVWPLAAARLPDARFHVVGSGLDEALSRELAGERIEVHGHVADLDPYLDGCRLAVAPLRYGAGVKGKVNLGMAHGQPVVATPVAVEGMNLVDGEDVLVAATAAEFADAIVRLYGDAALWQRLSDRGTENVRRHFSFDAARAALARILPSR